jgi:hypothetical protein
MVTAAFRQRRVDVAMIHGVAEMTKGDARAYMKDYFAAGGDMRSVAEWLQIAGGVLRQHGGGKAPDTAGSVVSTVGGWIDDAVDAAGDMINTVADAVKAAGKSLADAVGAVLNWTLDKIADFVRALLEAGRTVGGILAEAARKGCALLDVLVWAGSQAAATIQAVVKALREVGLQVAQILSAAVSLAAARLRAIVRALYKIGTRIGDILKAVANRTASIIRTVLEGLLSIGVGLAYAVKSICHDVAAGFRRGFFQGLIALGKAPLDILKAAFVSGAATLALAFAVFMEISGGHRPLTPEERAEARRVFGYSIDLGRVKVARASIPADVVNWLNGQRPFTTMYVINFSSRARITMGTLIHELTHVWQAVVAGPVYMVEALHSQFFGRGYEVTDKDLRKAAGDIRKLEREQQAVVVERYWRGRWGGESIDWQKYEPLARQVYVGRRLPLRDFDRLLPVSPAIGSIRAEPVRVR